MTDPIADLRSKFVRRCSDDLLVLRRGEYNAHLRGVIHRIAGAAGMFGYGELGALALDLDERDGEMLTPEALAALEQALEAVAREGDTQVMEGRA